MGTNTAALENGFNKATEIIRTRVIAGLRKEADKLALKAYDTYKSPLMGFTGNTWTGTAVGVYDRGALVYYVSTKTIANMPSAVRSKLKLGKTYFLSKPYGYIMDYSSGNRTFTPYVDTDGGNSEQDAIKFLESNSPNSKFAITVVNGSEYANYVENLMGGDVLIGTYHYAKNLRVVDLTLK